ncbi:MAG TPA: glycoside hydrolase family 2 TIM barrel-domain containing protein [Opitutaceae bacterium]
MPALPVVPPWIRRAAVPVALLCCIFSAAPKTRAVETLRQYVSGHGPSDAVPWEFFCTVGRNSGRWTTIPVPSQWELQGFGGYTYGEGDRRTDERGLYRTRFTVPSAWRDRRVRLVFEGVMTDAAVKVNGRPSGPLHQGGFYRFSHDITALVKFDDENLLEVEVAKASADPLVDDAERRADYWTFGGIFRPVYLEAVPAEAIAHAALDARADGALAIDVELDAVRTADRVEAQVETVDGAPVGARFSAPVPAGGSGRVKLATRIEAPRLWTAETPHLYRVQLRLLKGSEILHTRTERFGFRTFEVRPGEGLFLNGTRILLKGVNRHSFRPATGRALDRDDCYEDARTIKAMNMNAVRMSHYPPDEAFLEACDELGLYVLDELAGWQREPYGTEVGRRLVRAMVQRDVNHPSILFWDNGNEGGWNRDLDGEFARYDPQGRVVLHPWELFNGVDTKHYPNYALFTERLRGPHLFMPTEFLHGLYDGGHGAGLEDYWRALTASRVGAGGFLWVYADEAVRRADRDGRLDAFSTYAPDGILGPNLEREASFHTIRDLWSPVEIEAPTLDERFDGTLSVKNHYAFTSLAACRFTWALQRFTMETKPKILAEGAAESPAIVPGGTGKLALTLPQTWRQADALALTVLDPAGEELWTWVWPAPALATRLAARPAEGGPEPKVLAREGVFELQAGNLTAAFEASTGLLRTVRRGDRTYSLTNGPRLAWARPPSEDPQWIELQPAAAAVIAAFDGDAQTVWSAPAEEAVLVGRFATAQLANEIEVDLDYHAGLGWAGFTLEISADEQHWTTLYAGSRRQADGERYPFPPQRVAAVRISAPRTADESALRVREVRIGYANARFPGQPAAVRVTSGSGRNPETGAMEAWIDAPGAGGLSRVRWTLQREGALRLDYRYELEGPAVYHGVTFDQPEEAMLDLTWLGQGPYRVWKNRMRGGWLGVHRTERRVFQPGEAWPYPEFAGYYAGLRWARLRTAGGDITVTSLRPDVFLRVGTPRLDHKHTSPEFPAGNLSFLHAVPPIGTKFKPPGELGPASQWAEASGRYEGTLVFRFE